MTDPRILSRVADARRIFREQGLAPKKWMGQNLLVDDSYLERIVRAARIGPGDRVVEVGAGLGVLTEALVRQGARVWALEIDSGFCRVLEEKFRDSENVALIHADALKFDFPDLARKIGKLRVVANLPYSISSRLVFTFHENREIFSSLYILLQKEVAERLIAPSGTRDYGVLTVLLGVSAEAEILFDIPPKAFFPVPEVVSSLVRVSFPEIPPVEVQDPQLLVRLVKAAFSGRRKTLRNTLRSAPIPGLSPQILVAAADQAGIDLGRRAETLSSQEFATFADAILSKSNPPD